MKANGAHNESPPIRWTWAIAAAAVSGGLMATCYWPLNWHFLAWIALVPFLLVLDRLQPGRAWLYGIVVGLVFYRIGLGWLFKLHGPLGGLAVVGLSVLMGFSFRVAKLLMARCGTASMIWAVPVAFVGQEVLRSETLPRYRFAYLGWGYSQSHNLWIAQIASVGGVYLISFILVAFSAAMAYGIIRRRRGSWIPAAVIAVTTGILSVARQPRDDDARSQIPVACVQGEDLSHKEYVALTKQAASDPSRPRFIVLPEHTIQEMADEQSATVSALSAVARAHNAFICVGAHTRAPIEAQCDYDNVGLLIGPDGKIAGKQAKAVPVPFFQDGNPATSQSTFDSAYGRVGIYVCYDATFTDIPRRLVGLGAELMLAPLMDPEPWPIRQRWLHADMAPLRSIELRRCAVRAASSGISQIIDATGRVRAQRTREEGPGVICGKVYAVQEQTVFVRGGYLFASAIGVAFLGLVAILTFADWIGKLRHARRARRSGGADLRATVQPPTDDSPTPGPPTEADHGSR